MVEVEYSEITTTKQGSDSGPPHQELRALPTELLRPAIVKLLLSSK